MPIHGPGHLPAANYLGLRRYFVTFCTHSRRPLFTAPDRVDLVRSQILRAAQANAFAISAYCFMPDHLHLLVEATADDADGLRFIGRAKQVSGFHHMQTFGVRLWQRYAFERILRNDEAVLGVARYILENPIRARLVERVEDYPFCGSVAYSLAEILEAAACDPRSRGRSRTSG
jgi:putative transposase